MKDNSMKNIISRRKFIQALGLGVSGIGLLKMPAVVSALSLDSEPVDVMIIGSGFGGSVAALRLVEHGINTVMLERGKRWPVTSNQNTFSSLQNPDGRSAWLKEFAILGQPLPIDKYIGVLDLNIENGIATLGGAGVGGGSLVYAGVLYQPSEHLFERIFPNTVSYEEMNDIYYPRVRALIKPQPIPDKILNQRVYAAAKEWRKFGQKAGLETKLLDLGISWDAVWEEIAGVRVPSVIAGDFWYGNNSGAKMSLDKNYLHNAEQTGYLDIQTQQEVTSIAEGPDGRYLVTANVIDDNGSILYTRKYVVKKLFLGTGSMATSKLLVRAKGRSDLPALSSNMKIGMYWGNNGDFFSQITDLSKHVIPNMGGTATIAIEDHFNPIAPITVECYADWSQEGKIGLISSIGMATPAAKGVFNYDSLTDDVKLNWPGNDTEIMRATIEAGTKTYERIATAWGLDKRSVANIRSGHVELAATNPNARHYAMPAPIGAGITAHPLGGIVLDQATDNLGMVTPYDGLYVIDSSLIPGHTGCTNPALTIAALAERNIEKIIDRDFF